MIRFGISDKLKSVYFSYTTILYFKGKCFYEEKNVAGFFITKGFESELMHAEVGKIGKK